MLDCGDNLISNHVLTYQKLPRCHMETPNRPLNMYESLCSAENLKLAFYKARKGKTQKPYVLEFERNLPDNLLNLRTELLLQTYQPLPLKKFVLRDPKTRKISKSAFRDRIVHHAICNIIEPIFEKKFIHDSFANRIGKGTLNAVKRFDVFKRKISKNKMAALLKTSRTQVDRLLNPKSDITLSSLQRAAAMVGRRVMIELV